MLAGLVEPSSGRVEYGGRNMRDDPIAFRHELGYIPEEPYLYPFLSGREYLELIGRLREIPDRAADDEDRWVSRAVRADRAADQAIASYSKGMRQKIVISAALLHDPSVILFDEPESGLDVTTTLVLRHLVRTLAARGKAILYSSHILEVVERVCSRVIVLHEGAVVADDSVDRLQTLMSRSSLEGVFSKLVIRDRPERMARDLADAAALGAERRDGRAAQSTAILTRHFLRRFLENDLISPEADRAQLLAVVGAALFSTTIFVTLMMSFKYVGGFCTPGQAAVASLDDKFFYIALSMDGGAAGRGAMGCAGRGRPRFRHPRSAAAEAAVIRRRQAGGGGHLRRGRRAAGQPGADAHLSAGCSVNSTQLAVVAMLIIVTHAMVTLAAAAFGLPRASSRLRETLSAVIGGRWFRRVSPWVQGTLIVVLGTALLLLPPASSRIERNGCRATAGALAAGVVSRRLRKDVRAHPDDMRRGRQIEPLQRSGRARHGRLSPARGPVRRSLTAELAVALPSVALPPLRLLRELPAPAGRCRVCRAAAARPVARLCRALAIVRGPTARAGFSFTLAAMWRSSLHRLTLACAGAAGSAMSLVALSGIEFRTRATDGRRPTAVFVVQPFLRQSAGGIPPRDPRAGGTARQLGISARVARTRA